MREVTADPSLVARCGLYCGACTFYLKERCPGCRENTRANWCKIRACCEENAFASCADCRECQDPNDCKKFNNLISKAMARVFNSNRRACILKIRESGLDGFAALMAERKRHSMPRKGA